MIEKKGFTLVEIMVVVAILALLLAIAIPNLLNARRTANEAAAQAHLRILSTALETFSVVNNGEYAAADNTATDDYLRLDVPPYITTAYCGLTLNGYTYICDIDLAEYLITAEAAACGTSGNRDFNITTGGVLASAACM